GADKGADRLARGFLPVYEESPHRACRTALLLWTLPTLHFGGAVDVAARGAAQAAIAQRLPLGAVVRVLVRRIAKLVPGEVLARLVATIDDRDVGLDALPEEPRHELAAAVGLVGPQTLRAQAELSEMLEHPAGRHGLLPKARRGGDHIEDHAAGIVDEIVVVVREPGAPPLHRPRGVGIGGGQGPRGGRRFGERGRQPSLLLSMR